ncbi:MAG: cytochrome C assembly family protein [Burkholderiales bacterium]
MLYALCAVLVFRGLRRSGAHDTPLTLGVWQRGLIPSALAYHGFVIYHALFATASLNLSLANAVSALLWLTVAIYWMASFFYEIAGLQALVLPSAALGTLLPVVLPETHVLPYTGLAAFKIHLLVAFTGYSLFIIAALHASLMAMAERRLHAGDPVGGFMLNLAPLLTMEKLLFRIIGAGFILLTLTVASGMMFSEQLFGKAFQFNHKTVFSLLAWVIFAALLAGRRVYGWRGPTAVRWTLSGFAMLMLAYLGSKFVLEVILQR